MAKTHELETVGGGMAGGSQGSRRGERSRRGRVMTRALWVLWAVVPVGLFALHQGPGAPLAAQGQSADHAARAQALEDAGQWKEAAAAWALARDTLPLEKRGDAKRFALREAKAMMFADELVEGMTRLEDLLADELAQDEPDAELATTLRGEIAAAAYYTAWQMRLEGANDDEWLPETDKARQHLRFLAESADAAGDTIDAEEHRLNLESVVRLEQMTDEELRAIPLPSNCPKCNGVSQKKRDQRASKSKGKGKSDAREDIQNDGASEAVNQGKGH
jgi:hypothetical protein